MSKDPYHEVATEVQSALQTTETLLSSYMRIRSTARSDSEELIYARNELKATLSALEADLDDLEESVHVVEQTGARMFGLEESEVIDRRRYVRQVRKELENMRSQISPSESSSTSRSGFGRGTASPHRPASRQDFPNGAGSTSSGYGNTGLAEDSREGDDQAEWSKAEQEMILREQDNALSSISGTLNTLATQAGLIGQEVVEHNELLDDLERNVDRTDTKLNSSLKRLRKFIRDTEETKSGWCIAILIVILLVLLLAVILV